MKTIVCGPPHSGKSVLMSNLDALMPSEAYQRVNANGDGENTWSNNPNQEEVKRYRHKMTNNPEDFANWTSIIKKAIQQIVLVDIGGRLQDDKIPLFEACDSFIVLSNNEDDVTRWREFGELHGCRCLATILSLHNPENPSARFHEEIVSTESCLKAELSELERGHNLGGSKVITTLAETIISASGYSGFKKRDDGCIDFYDIGVKLGLTYKWHTSNGLDIHSIFPSPRMVAPLCEYLQDNYSIADDHYIYGVKKGWLACIVAKFLANDNLTNIQFYDEWTDEYRKSCLLQTCDMPKTSDLCYDIVETDTAVFVRFHLESAHLNNETYPSYELPMVSPYKKLYISGRFPNWFITAVVFSYPNAVKYVFVPGRYFICVDAPAMEKLGTTVKNEFD